MDLVHKIPTHVAIIMDGNGRWAAERGHERLWGHSYGIESVKVVVKKSLELGIKYLTIYAFSTENWGRPKDEVSGLMSLFTETLDKETNELAEAGVRLKFIGDIERLSDDLQKKIARAENVDIKNEKLTLVIAINYSSRWEITNAVRQIVSKGYSQDEITEDLITENLSTSSIPDPDLLIRTSGEIRLSNFLLWQLSYSEMYFTSILWPDFDGNAFEDAVKEYSKRDRRWGKL